MDHDEEEQVGTSHRIDSSRWSLRRSSASVPDVTQAYAVDDDIYDATPLEPTPPWWKQKRTKVLLGVVLLLISIMAIVLGVELSKDRTVTKLIGTTISPSISIMPSSSQTPSSSPSTCSYTISTAEQNINLLRPDPREPRVAIDGRNLVVCSWSRDNLLSSFYIIFYSLSDDSKWEMVGYFIEGNVDWGSFGDCTPALTSYDVSLSGSQAVIGLPAKDIVYVYKRNSNGLWVKVESLHPENQIHRGLGHSVSTDGDLVAVQDSSVNYILGVGLQNGAYLFKDIGGKWSQIFTVNTTIPYEYCDAIGLCAGAMIGTIESVIVKELHLQCMQVMNLDQRTLMHIIPSFYTDTIPTTMLNLFKILFILMAVSCQSF